ncbi:RES family NAD+ phosphorylase [Aromatoleum diolicum]|uniref:RES domain-containing protein n=1 Tax=Aromatoleum diolicum TaxID=75796 RepID=A0ABX1Q6W3_9RHOO|nr:RES family NAD+ phosphorylase [Aromatoleum diolicum]NMG74104.1 RES domain-containing protein [Aromatoleum diolicum]
MNFDRCDVIIDQALSSKSEAEFCHYIAPLFNTYEILSVGLGRGNIFWRARAVESDVWENVFDLDYPPAEKARRGRLNDVGVPCFYVAKDIQTALLEVEATEGQLIQIAGFRVLADEILRLIVVGEYANVQKNGYMHFSGTDPGRTIQKLLNQQDKNALPLLYIDKFLANVIGDPAARESNYAFSIALGAFLHSKVDADGIAYPSIRDPGGFNLAVPPLPSDRVFHNVACVLVKVGKRRRFGVLDYQIVSSATRIDEQLNFIWPDRYQSGQLNIYGLNKQEYDFSCNRVGNNDAMFELLSMYSPRNVRDA